MRHQGGNMHTMIHLIFGAIIAFVLGLSVPMAALFVLASALMDLDHATDIRASRKNAFSMRDIFSLRRFREFNYRTQQVSMHLFHTFEFLVILFLASSLYHPLFWIGAAFSAHLAIDALGNILNRNLGTAGGNDWIKYWFISYHLMKRPSNDAQDD